MCAELLVSKRNVVGRIAPERVLAFFQPEQSNERQPTSFTLEISPALLLPLREFLRVGIRIDRRLRRFPGA